MLAWQLTLSLLPSTPPRSKLGASLRRTALRSSLPNLPPPRHLLLSSFIPPCLFSVTLFPIDYFGLIFYIVPSPPSFSC